MSRTVKWSVIALSLVVLFVVVIKILCSYSQFIPPECDHSQDGILLLADNEDDNRQQERSGKQRGVCWEAAQGEPSEDGYYSFLRQNNVDWISITPFGWQSNYNEPGIKVKPKNEILPCIIWGETDEGIRLTTQYARKHNIRTMLKPHIWLSNKNGKWRQDIAMKNESMWKQWFKNYEGFILHYAQLAENNRIPIFCIGTELRQAAKRTADWEQLIRCIRQVYSGELIYAANWDEEYEGIQFWDQLDYIGIQAYFPLTKKEDPAVDDLISGWQPHAQAIERIQKKYNKPVLFTEIGYKNSSDAAIEPWVWPQDDFTPKLSLETQANAFEAFFEVFWDKPWFKGAYIWKWTPTNIDDINMDEYGRKRAATLKLSPQFTPAMSIIKSRYGAHVEGGEN